MRGWERRERTQRVAACERRLWAATLGICTIDMRRGQREIVRPSDGDRLAARCRPQPGCRQREVVTVEEVFELQLLLPDVVSMQTRQANLEGTGDIPLRRLVKEALRMRPSRLIVGEVRQEECLDLLIALNSGIPGMCTLHANSAREDTSSIGRADRGPCGP
jgi:hypothetical protein